MPKTLAICFSLLVLLSAPLNAQPEESGPTTETATRPKEVAAVQPEQPPLPPATPCVEKLHAALTEVMKNAGALGYQGRYAQLTPIVAEAFDLSFMAEKTVGRHWKKLAERDQARWVDAFERLTTATYADRFEGYSGETFQTDAEQPAIHNTMMVLTTLTRPDGEDVHLNYRLHRTGDTWKIIDVYLDGTVSELALRRSEYSSVLKRRGFEELIDSLDGKVAEMADNPAG
jgi:phospholipid transport system substrate-binding protein